MVSYVLIFPPIHPQVFIVEQMPMTHAL